MKSEDSEVRQTLADFLNREIGGARSLRSWALKNGLEVKDVQRAAAAATSMTIDKLALFATALGVEPWQLLFPGYERGAPQFPTLSFEALDLARRVDSITDESRRRKLVAGMVNTLEAATDAPAPPPAATVEPIQPAHDTTPRRFASR